MFSVSWKAWMSVGPVTARIGDLVAEDRFRIVGDDSRIHLALISLALDPSDIGDDVLQLAKIFACQGD